MKVSCPGILQVTLIKSVEKVRGYCNRALDMLLLTEEMHGLRALKDDIDFWQERYFDTLANHL